MSKNNSRNNSSKHVSKQTPRIPKAKKAAGSKAAKQVAATKTVAPLDDVKLRSKIRNAVPAEMHEAIIKSIRDFCSIPSKEAKWMLFNITLAPKGFYDEISWRECELRWLGFTSIPEETAVNDFFCFLTNEQIILLVEELRYQRWRYDGTFLKEELAGEVNKAFEALKVATSTAVAYIVLEKCRNLQDTNRAGVSWTIDRLRREEENFFHGALGNMGFSNPDSKVLEPYRLLIADLLEAFSKEARGKDPLNTLSTFFDRASAKTTETVDTTASETLPADEAATQEAPAEELLEEDHLPEAENEKPIGAEYSSTISQSAAIEQFTAACMALEKAGLEPQTMLEMIQKKRLYAAAYLGVEEVRLKLQTMLEMTRIEALSEAYMAVEKVSLDLKTMLEMTLIRIN